MKKKSMLIVAILLMSIGFAAISTTLIINGTAKVSENNEDFSVIFTAASIDGNDVYSTAVDETKKTITFTTSDLKTLNQTSVLNYEVTNNSSNYDAEVNVTCVPKEGTTAKYTSIRNELEGNATVITAKNTVNGTLTVTLNKTATEEVREEYTCTITANAVERDTLGNSIPEPVTFSEDSWSTIAANVKAGNTDNYNVGDTKKVTIASHTNDCSSTSGNGASYVCNSSVEPEKELTVRIANKSECTNGETSETACGFVVEFVDIIEKHNYNKTDATNKYGTNIGGWRDSKLRTYINDTIYKSLPSDLQNVITTTKVISGHGSTSGETNFETQDKLYLLSGHEVYEDGTSKPISAADTSYNNTKQLDYYKNQGVTTSSYDGTTKQYNARNDNWWLRTATSSRTDTFLLSLGGNWNDGYVTYSTGVSPAFRIA